MNELTIFDYLKDVLFLKKGSLKEDSQLQPYMLQRWCSMSSKDINNILNETTNRWSIMFEDKKFIYKLLLAVLPKQKQKKISYIKKVSSPSLENLKELSNFAEISQREIKMYIKFNSDINYDKLDSISK